PAEAAEERHAGRREARKSPLTPSQRARKPKARPRKAPGQRYTPDSYRQAIGYACDRANPHPALSGIPDEQLTAAQRGELAAWKAALAWHPNQLRHSAATRLRKEFGLDVARVILGHSSPAVTEVYAEVDREKAARIMEQIG